MVMQTKVSLAPFIHTHCKIMNKENRLLVRDEVVEFEKQPAEVQDLRKITYRFRGIYRTYPHFPKQKMKDVNI